ncbi:MAG: D-amino-acid oxidase [Actinomycetota bacterium]|jgi:D-amino-acid oxidase|nr:D-amino-acid oxidase [Actinomycetota bacterium]
MVPVRVVVVGAGVVGLTCAVRLAEAGHEAHVLARDLPHETTSAVAAALWYPYRALPQDRVTAWSARTYEVLTELARQPGTGVQVRDGVELLGPEAPDQPWWRAAVPDLTTVPDPAPGYPHGWRLALPVAEMDVYLDHLVARLEQAGGTLTRHWLAELPASGVVVNASGLASRALAGDGTLSPVRGQVVKVAQTGVKEWLIESSDEERPLYVVPREHDVVVGGTADAGSWNLSPDPETATAILARATALVPALRGAEVLAHRVGLRPARPAVRLEAVPHPDGESGGVVHCYGHGGAGVTLSWGCADDVLVAVEELLESVRR